MAPQNHCAPKLVSLVPMFRADFVWKNVLVVQINLLQRVKESHSASLETFQIELNNSLILFNDLFNSSNYVQSSI